MPYLKRLKRQIRESGPYKRHELLTGRIIYPAYGYTGYGDGKSHDIAYFISDEMRADWADNRDELLEFWDSGKYTVASVFPDSKPWLLVCGSKDSLPWAERMLEQLKV